MKSIVNEKRYVSIIFTTHLVTSVCLYSIMNNITNNKQKNNNPLIKKCFMINNLEVSDFLNRVEEIPVLDLRSPGEYEAGHIPNAINMPIFNNEERAKVGTAYKQQSKDAAILIGLDIVGPKMSSMVRKAKSLAVDGEVCLYCWRGGMRSGSVAWLLSTAGLKVTRLVGGYKAYRHYIRDCFSQEVNLVVLGGMTGSGKTDILLEMLKQGHQVLDLEGYANHKGSAFGMLGQPKQPTTEQFENDTYEVWKTFDLTKPVWLEDESRLIGNVAICEPLFEKIRATTVIKIEPTKQHRIERLIRDYAVFDNQLLKDAIARIQKRLGGQNAKLCYEALDKGDYATVADITLNYYDKAYMHGLKKRSGQLVYPLPLESSDPVVNAKVVTDFYSSIKNI